MPWLAWQPVSADVDYSILSETVLLDEIFSRQDPGVLFATDAELQQLTIQFEQHRMTEPRSKKISGRKFTIWQPGKSDWVTIAEHFPAPSRRQGRDRWEQDICPYVVTGNWMEEETLVLWKVQEFGQKWSTIATFFPGRTDIGVKNRYINITNRKTKDYGFRSTMPGLTEDWPLASTGGYRSAGLPPRRLEDFEITRKRGLPYIDRFLR
jgi:hypothetical protein